MAALALVLGGLVVAGRTLLHRYESAVSHDVLLDPSARDADSLAGSRLRSGPLNLLLVGSDRPAVTADRSVGQRTDTILIVHVSADRTRADLISVPRDLRVRIPRFASTGFAGSREKINAAFERGGGTGGGVRLLSATLTKLTGVRFDGAAVIDFSGFVRVIDALGGVRMCVDTAVTSIHTGRRFAVGCQSMTGPQALDYSRQRYGLPGGDYDRQRHQQQLAKAVLAKAVASGVAVNPFKIDALIRSIGRSLTVDTGKASLARLVLALSNIRPGSLVGIRVPSHPRTIRGVSYVLRDDESTGLFRALRHGDLTAWARSHPRWVNAI